MDDNEKLYTGEGIIDNDEVTIIHPSQVIKNPEPTPPPGDSDSEIGFDDWKFGNPDDFLEKKEKKPKDSTPYVTKRFFAIAIIVVMIFSSAISSFVAVKMVGAARSYNNLSTNSLEKATGSKLTIAEIIALNQDSVVEITTSGVEANMFGQTQVVEGAGSGVIVNEKGYIVTNYHVVEGSTSVKVTLRNGKNHTASIVGSDPDNDIAVIKINATGLKAVTLGDSSKLAVGDMTVAIGNPLGQLGGTATQGIVSALQRRLTINNKTLTLLQTDAAINPGNSGGGLFNGAGELIGIVVAKSSGTGIEGLGFAIPINSVAGTIDSLISTGKIEDKPSIGITIYDVGEDETSYYKVDKAGVYVKDVTSDEAKSAGFKANDRLISINGNEAISSSDFIARVRENKIGDTITVVVERDGKELTLKAKLIPLTTTDDAQK